MCLTSVNVSYKYFVYYLLGNMLHQLSMFQIVHNLGLISF